jgi:hypothetical protein
MRSKRPPLKVATNGTVTISKKIVEEMGGHPGELVELADKALHKAGLPRRAVLKLLYVGASILAVTSSLISHYEFIRNIVRKASETDSELLARLFGTIPGHNTALAPARHHPFRPLKENEAVYPIEAECCRAYLAQFAGSYEERSVNGILNIYPKDNVVLFGSQVSNLVTRDILGNPFANEPLSNVVYQESGKFIGHIPLRWNMLEDANSPLRVRRQYGKDWHFKDHSFYDFRDNSYLKLNNYDKEDFLLITSLPRWTEESLRVLIFSGLHGAGTLSTALLLHDPPLKELRRLATLTGGNSHYQALFRVILNTDPMTSELGPKSMELLDAQPLVWRSRQISIQGHVARINTRA